MRCIKIGTHCVHVGSASYIHENDALVSQDRAECFALGSSIIVSLTKPTFPWDSNIQNKFCVA